MHCYETNFKHNYALDSYLVVFCCGVGMFTFTHMI